ncbi:MAG TPA: magnesium-translocating P-type ATPase, partial [Chitinophaga sp.]
MQPASSLPTANFWSRATSDVLAALSCTASGLSEAEAAQRLAQYGPNRLREKSNDSVWRLFLAQFKSPITLMLIITAILSASLGDISDTAIILVIVVMSGLLGFWQEKGANKAVQELLKMVQLHFTVLRNGRKTEMPFEAAVPGDVICLSAGDIIPADCLLLGSDELFVDEAAFTGESFPVEKQCGMVPPGTPLMKRTNTLFMGSSVISGSATALVAHTGRDTEFGKIAASLQQGPAETDFEKGIRKFGYLLLELTLVLVLLIFAINVILHKPALDSFLFSLALAVGLTPQLLPAIISINLSTGATRMAAKKVVVKRLSSIENLGSMNVLCSDKTGTLTEGKVVLKDALDVTGQHSPKAAQYAWINATLQQGFRNPIDEAIAAAFPEGGQAYTLLGEIPYDFIRKRLSVQVANGAGSLLITKGAFNSVIGSCNMVETPGGPESIDAWLPRIQEQYQAISNEGYRTLGLAYRLYDTTAQVKKEGETGLTFLGFVTFYDPPKAGITTTVQQLQAAGVALKIITGDNALVTGKLAAGIGLADAKVITGAALQHMSSAALVQQVRHVEVFAEMEPSQKERVIIALQQAGYVVGYMGDGINDASALHAADVGISVDTAVDVAKQAADIVLLERDLGVLQAGILEGRKTFANTMKYIFMATSANFGNMFSMAGASLFLPFLPLLPKQILLTNLLTDLPETAIAKDNVDLPSIQHPQHWNLDFIRRFM